MRIRPLTALPAALLLAVLSVSPAAAQDGYPDTDTSAGTGTVSDTTVAAGEAVSFGGSGFASAATIDLAVNGASAGSVTASASGAFNADVEVTDCGVNTLSATGEGAAGERRVVTSSVTVACEDDGSGGTGGDTDTDDGAGSGGDGDSDGGSATGTGGGSLPFTGSAAVLTSLVAGLVLLAVGALLVAGGRRRRLS